jgi:polar amino acid transport system substrate-binding protein
MRASINLGDPILASKNPQTGAPFGVAVDLARWSAKTLSVELQLVVFDKAGKSVQAVSEERADFGSFVADPLRGEKIALTAPYMLNGRSYLLRDDSTVRTSEDVDQTHNRVAVGRGSAYDLFLTPELKAPQIARAPSSPNVMQTFLDRTWKS